MPADEGISLRKQFKLGRDHLGECLREELCLIESAPTLPPFVERDEEHHIREWQGRFVEFVSEEMTERNHEALPERIFVSVNDLFHERILEGCRREDAVERTLASASMTENAVRSRDSLAVRTMESGFLPEIPCTMVAEERAFSLTGEAGEGEEEIKESLKKYLHFSIIILSSDNRSIVQDD
jgi:hypothetical protein